MPRVAEVSELECYRKFLSIDKTALDECLMEQPEVYHHVSNQYTLAVARRDLIKMELEEEIAVLDRSIRDKAAAEEEKLTEGAISNRIKVLPKIKEKSRRLLDAKLEADQWGALKEGFQQRSFALREVVAIMLREQGDLSLEGGAGQAKAMLAERNRREASKLRQNTNRP